MSGPARLLIVDPTRLSDGAIVTASTYSGEMLPGNVQDKRLDYVWQSTGDSSEWLKFNFGAAESINCICFHAGNLTQDATIKVEASANDSSWTTILDTTSIFTSIYGFGEGGFGEHGFGGSYLAEESGDWEPVIFYEWPDANYRYWRVTFVDAANPDTWLEIPRLAFDNFLAFGDIQWPRVKINDPSATSYTIGAAPRSAKATKFWTVDFTFGWLEESAVYADAVPFVDRVGTTEDFYLLLDESEWRQPHADRQRWYGRLTSPLDYLAAIIAPIPFSFRQTR